MVGTPDNGHLSRRSLALPADLAGLTTRSGGRSGRRHTAFGVDTP